MSEPRKSVLRTAYTEAETKDALDRVVDDVAGMVPLDYLAPWRVYSEPAKEPAGEILHGTVSTFLEPDGALVTLEDGCVARVALPESSPYFDASRLLPQGMRVSGTVADGLMETQRPEHVCRGR